MTWSYTPGTIATVPKDQVRLLIGDTNPNQPHLQDEEIRFLLGLRGSLYGAAAEAARSIQGQLSSLVDQQASSSKIWYSQAAKAYGRLALRYEQKVALTSVMPYAGGISLTDMQMQELDTDRVPPQFAIGFMDAMLPVPPAGNWQTEENVGLGPGP